MCEICGDPDCKADDPTFRLQLVRKMVERLLEGTGARARVEHIPRGEVTIDGREPDGPVILARRSFVGRDHDGDVVFGAETEAGITVITGMGKDQTIRIRDQLTSMIDGWDAEVAEVKAKAAAEAPSPPSEVMRPTPGVRMGTMH